MKKLLNSICLLVISLVTHTVYGAIGMVTSYSDIIHTPTAIAYQGSLVVFYHRDANKTKTYFSIGTPGVDGTLIWSAPYQLDTQLIHGNGVTPVPATLNNSLYVFGRSTNNELIYNGVNSLSDLKSGKWKSEAFFSHKNSNEEFTQLDANLKNFAAIEYAHGDLNTDDEDKERRVMIVYYEQDSKQKFSFSNCGAVDSSAGLACYGGKFDYDTSDHYSGSKTTKFDGAPHLFVPFNEDRPGDWVEMYLRDVNAEMRGHFYQPQHGYGNEIYTWWNFNNDIPKDAIKASKNPVGTAQILDPNTGEYLTQIYYQASGEDPIYRSNETAQYSGSWTKGEKVNGDLIRTNNDRGLGVTTVTYNGYAYVLYVEKDTRILRYYTDTKADVSPLP